MHDELPAPPTTDGAIGDSTTEPVEPADARRERDERPERDEVPPAVGATSPRSRDGVDPPEEEVAPPDGAPDGVAPDCDEDDADGKSHAYRLERLRLWRTLATLAVVVARLIRSL